MGRIRTIKPEFFKHGGLYDAERETSMPLRVAFAGLWTQCDRAGRFRWRPRELKLDVLPYDPADMADVLDALATRGFIVKYTVDGEEFGWVPSFTDHQVINNREQKSLLPDPPKNHNKINHRTNASAARGSGVDDASATREARGSRGREGKGTGKEGDRDSPAAPELSTARATGEAAVRVGVEVLKRFGRDQNSVPNFGPVLAWLSNGYGEAEIIAVAERMAPRIGADIRNPLQYLAKAMPEEIEQHRTRTSAAAQTGSDERVQWKFRYGSYVKAGGRPKGIWLGTWGPRPPVPPDDPGEPNHWVPQDVIDEVALELPAFLKRV